MEKEGLGKNYIGEVSVLDVCAYANTHVGDYSEEYKSWEYAPGIVDALCAHKNNYVYFCWPAALTETLWYVYRGMVKEAIIFDMITMLLSGIMFHFSFIAGIVTLVVAAIAKGIYAMPLYYLRIRDAAEKRGLLMRSSVESPAAKESLEKEGKPSVKRAILYLFFKCFAAVCLDSVLYSMFAILGV